MFKKVLARTIIDISFFFVFWTLILERQIIHNHATATYCRLLPPTAATLLPLLLPSSGCQGAVLLLAVERCWKS